MSDANRVSVATIQETLYASRDPVTGVVTPPASGYTYQRITSESLERTKETIASEEIRADRQVSDIPQVDIGARGSLMGEIAYDGPTPEVWAAMLMLDSGAAWTNKVLMGPAPSITVSVDTTANETTYTAASGTTFSGIQEGSMVRVTGFANAANNGWKIVRRCVQATGKDLVVAGVGVVETFVGAVFEAGDEMLTGTTTRSLAIEKTYNDIVSTSKYHLFTGMMVDRWMIECELGRISRWTLDFLGANASVTTVQRTGYVANTPYNYGVLNSIDNFKPTDPVYGIDMMAASIEVRNGARPRGQMGTLGKVASGLGRVMTSGTIRQYFASQQALTRFLDHQTATFGFALIGVGPTNAAGAPTVANSAGAGFSFALPNVRVTGWRAVAGGIDQDLIAEISFTGIQYVPSVLQTSPRPTRSVFANRFRGQVGGGTTLLDFEDPSRRSYSEDMAGEAAHNVAKRKAREAEMAADRKRAA